MSNPVNKPQGTHIGYIWEKNRSRILIVLGILTFLVLLNGAKGVVESTIALIASAPALLLNVVFAMTYIVFYFGFMFWFLSRPRKYVTTPDDAQINLSFENYRGQPDLLEHAKSTVRILSGEAAFAKAGGEMPKGMLLTGRPGTGKTFLAGCIAAEAGLPFIYVDASSLRGMFWGMDSLMVMKLFRDARGLGRKYAQPGQRGACILFMDELDSIGMARGGQGGMGVGMGGHVRRRRIGRPEHPAQPDGLAGRPCRGPLEPQGPALVRLHPRTRPAEAARLRHRRDQPARRPGPGTDPTRPPRPDAGGLRPGRRGSPRHHPVTTWARSSTIRTSRSTSWSPTPSTGPRS